MTTLPKIQLETSWRVFSVCCWFEPPPFIDSPTLYGQPAPCRVYSKVYFLIQDWVFLPCIGPKRVLRINAVSPLLYLFSILTTFDIFLKISPLLDYRINTKLNLWQKVISSCLEDHKTTLNFFYKENFYMQHQTEIWLEIITISGIKRSSKKKKNNNNNNNNCKWKTYWVKSIIATKFIHY